MTISNYSSKEALNLFESKLSLIDQIKGEALVLTCIFLNRRKIEYGDIIEFIRCPQEYPGDPNGPKKIFESNLDKIMAKHIKEIQEVNLSISFVYNTILKQITTKKRR